MQDQFLGMYHRSIWDREVEMKCPLEIAAPVKDFSMDGMKIDGGAGGSRRISKIEVPDPIVLKPVFFNNQKHYLIVTAWGLEAADEMVMNPVHN